MSDEPDRAIKKPAGCDPCSYPECGCAYSQDDPRRADAMSDEQLLLIGKTIEHASYNYEAGCNDALTLRFTDGSIVTIRAMSCQDDTGALLFDAERLMQ